MEPSHSSEEHPPEHHQIKRTLWQRWMDWSGSFLVVSILVHLILLGGATVLVVQVVQGKKEKLKFTAPPPSAAGPTEYKVKPSKKTAAAAPAISKRITSTAANVSVALPAMDLNSSSTGPDLMASAMSGMGASGLGSGAGAAGMASMPLAGMTAFGFKGMSGQAGLVGHLYDLKQTKDRKETDIKDDGVFTQRAADEYKKRGKDVNTTIGMMWNEIMADRSPYGKRADLVTPGYQNHGKVVSEFLNKGWDESVLQRYYVAQDPLTAFQIFIPWAAPMDALKAFGVEKEIKKTHFVIHYKGYVKAPKDGEYRFRSDPGTAQCGMYIRYDGMNVLGTPLGVFHDMKSFNFPITPGDKDGPRHGVGRWFPTQAGKRVPVEFLLENGPSGLVAMVYIEERHPEKPYPPSLVSQVFPQFPGLAYPVFALRKGLPLPPRTTKEQIEAQKAAPNFFRPQGLDYSEPLIFQGCK